MQKILTVAFMASIWSGTAFGQCGTWQNSPQKDLIETEHVLYRQFIKTNEFDKAFEHWEKAYKGAPAADGQRSSHYADGRKIYMHKYKNATDAARKKEYESMVLKLYAEQVECYPNEAALALGLKVYDMFYVFNADYADTKKACEDAVVKGGLKTSYVLFQPYASIAVYQYQNKQMTAEEARNVYAKLNEIAEYGIAHSKEYAAYFKQGQEAMNGAFGQIESEIFDCAYFKTKYEPQYRAKPDDSETLKLVYNRLLQQGCPEDDAFVQEIKVKYDVIVAAENAEKLAGYYAENPGDHGITLFKEGDYAHALRKFDEGIEKEKAGANDSEKLANYYFYIASIEFRQLDRYSNAREHARMAARYKPNWGQPYLLIGDMYASTSNSCGGDAFDKQLAVIAAIDKYAYAKSIDPEVASEANSKIGRYSAYLPEKEEAFMRKVKEGDSMTTPCWIGETVRVRFK